METTKFETRQKQALKYHHGLLHDIDCWKIRQQGGVELNDFWIQDLKNRAQFEKELKYFQNLKGKPIVKKNSSGVAAVTIFKCNIFLMKIIFIKIWGRGRRSGG